MAASYAYCRSLLLWNAAIAIALALPLLPGLPLAAASTTPGSTSANNRNLRSLQTTADIDPPVISSLLPESGTFITVGSYQLEAVVSDDASGLRSVQFQLRDPSGNRLPFFGGTGTGDGVWHSGLLDLSSADGTWAWRVRATDRARNRVTSDWSDLTVHASGNPGPDLVVSLIRSDLEDLIDRRPELSTKFLRLSFHDAVGGMDGCVDLGNGDNNGLDVPIDALEPIVQQYAHNDDYITLAGGVPISRADIWALAAMARAEKAQPPNDEDFTSFPLTHVGRVDCERKSPSPCDGAADGIICDARNGPPRDLPSPDLTTHGLLTFFSDEFGFSPQETTAIMGAHTLGTASRGNSGFDGQSGWVNNNRVLANGYYDLLVGDTTDPTREPNIHELRHAPQWTVEFINNNNRPEIPSRFQWFHQKQDQSTENVTDTRQLDKIIMLNSDIALVRNLTDHLNTDTGEVTGCQFRCGGQDISTGCPNRNPPVCPMAAQTVDLAYQYKTDNGLWLRDFQAVLTKMTLTTYTPDPSCSSEDGDVCLLLE